MEYSIAIIDKMLQPFKAAIGKDYDKYKNHVYRVFLNCCIMDAEKSNEEKYAIAAVFHDIGIWTDHTIDYLAPSLKQAEIYLAANNKMHVIEEVLAMIYWHHKISKYKGAHSACVEVFRKADWIDVSLGWLTYGADKKKINANRKLLPNKGFHLFLLKKIGRNLFRHPLHPLPMFKI